MFKEIGGGKTAIPNIAKPKREAQSGFWFGEKFNGFLEELFL